MRAERWSGRPEECTSDIVFDRLLAGDLAAGEAAAVRSHGDGCPACAARLAEMEASRAHFEADPVRLRLPARRPSVTPRRWLVPAAAAVLCAVLLLLVRVDESEPIGGTRRKGDGAAVFQLHVGRSLGIVRAGSGDVVHPGDTLQLAYSAESRGYIAVLARDGSGAVSVYFPAGAATAWPAPPGHDRVLPQSTVLDGVLGRETIYALHCAEPIELEPLRRRLSASESAFPASCAVQEILLDKRGLE
jgi:anti-sigma factor RsiW